MKPFRLTPEAAGDLEGIIDYIAQESPDAALRVLGEFDEAFSQLARTPGIGHYREDLLDSRQGFTSLNSYLIVYRWKTEPIQIIAIVHGARDLAPFFQCRQ